MQQGACNRYFCSFYPPLTLTLSHSLSLLDNGFLSLRSRSMHPLNDCFFSLRHWFRAGGTHMMHTFFPFLVDFGCTLFFLFCTLADPGWKGAIIYLSIIQLVFHWTGGMDISSTRYGRDCTTAVDRGLVPLATGTGRCALLLTPEPTPFNCACLSHHATSSSNNNIQVAPWTKEKLTTFFEQREKEQHTAAVQVYVAVASALVHPAPLAVVILRNGSSIGASFFSHKTSTNRQRAHKQPN